LTIKKKLYLYYKRLNYLNKKYLIKTINNTSKFNNKLTKKLKTKNITNYKNYKTSNFIKYNNLIPFKKTILLFIKNINIIQPFKIKNLKNKSYFISFTNKDSKIL